MNTLDAAQLDAAQTAEQSARSTPPRLHFIDGLRGLAMLSVLLYHCWLFGGQWQVTASLGVHRLNCAAVLGFGHVGVNLFLVLSGFCLFWPFTQPGRPEPTLWVFARKRCRRILPPYYAVLVLCGGAALASALRDHDPAAVRYTLNWLWLHALMAQNLRPGYVLALNGSLWSLALEFQLYLLFPVLVEAYRRFNARGVLWTVLALCSLYRFLLVRAQCVSDDSLGYVLAYSVFGRAFEFALGMFTALLVARQHAAQKWLLHPADLAVLSAVTVEAVLDGRHGHFQTLTDAMWGLWFAALILAGSRTGTVLHRALSSRVLMGLGIFSYSVYLIHLPLVFALGSYGVAHFSSTGRALLMLFGTAPLMLLLGWGFHCVFERPFMAAPKKAPSRPA